MRSVGGSYAQIKSFLKELEEKGFLIKKGVHWLTTPQGKSYIKLFEKIKNLID
jgi:predicted transcriptional regulator